MPPKTIAELKPWKWMHINLKVPYIKSILKQPTGGYTIQKYVNLNYITIIVLASGWLKIV